MTYEIVLTDSCTRKCNFCWVQQTGYIASQEDVQKFISEVNAREYQKTSSRFSVSLFGGEPLLNPTGIKQVVEAFANDKRVSGIDICTNADLFDKFQQEHQDLVPKLAWAITAYDFFDSAKRNRYLELAKTLNAVLMYTFTEDDIELAEQLSDVCWSNDVRFKLAFSHADASWSKLRSSELYDKVFKLMHAELEKTLDNFPRFRSLSIMKPLRSVVGHLLGGYQGSKCCWCIDYSEKLSFYNGKFVGSCMREKAGFDVVEGRCIPQSCKHCDYTQICTKSCIFEHARGSVPEKLCMLEKAQLDAFCQFAEAKKHDARWRLILRSIIENDGLQVKTRES